MTARPGGAVKDSFPASRAARASFTAPHAAKGAFTAPPRVTDLVELVRGPAALSVVGDSVAGAVAAGGALRGRRWVLPLASVALHWAGMALNDWADRELDAVERPERPVPSGRVRPGTALGVGVTLTAAGLGLAAVGDGRRGLRVAAPLAGAVWVYDTRLKGTVLGPAGMATCRALDVLLGAGHGAGTGRAACAAAALGVHTLGVTAVSAGEVHGGSARTAGAALAGTALATTLALTPSRPGHAGRAGSGPEAPRSGRRPAWGSAGRRAGRPGGARVPAPRADRRAPGTPVAAVLAAVYAGTVGRAQYAVVRRPSADNAGAATAAGIHGMVPLQAAVAARHGAARTAVALAAALPLARRLARKVSPT